MTAKKKKKRLKIFYPVYFILLTAAVAAVFVICGQISERLESYEASLPKYAAEEVAQMFLDRDFERVYAYQDPADFAGEDAATYAAYMTRFTEGSELTWGESYSSSEAEMVYAIRMNGKRLFEFTLVKSAQPDAQGNDQWHLSDVRTLGVTTATHTITAPSNSSVYVGGKLLDASHVIEEGIAIESADYLLNEDAKSPTMSVYQYETCFGEPEIRVVDEQGRENALTVDENGDAMAQINGDDALKAEAEERVVEIVKAFARFTSEDLSQRDMLKLVRKGTKAYDKIKDFDNDWFGKHSGTDFENMTTDNYMPFSADTFACDIHFDYIVHYSNADDVRYESGYRCYFVERDGKWYLYDFKRSED